jgi:hypothetical protein
VLLLLRLALPDAVATLERDIHYFAKREPNRSRVNAEGDALIGGYSADRSQHQVMSEHSAVFNAELVGDCHSEFTHAHGSTVAGKRNAPVIATGAFRKRIVGLARNEARVELRNEFVSEGIRNRIHAFDHRETLDDRQAIADLTHDD